MASPARPDLVIVGGGIIGCSAAATAAARGARVLLLEATAIAARASGRNSGALQHPFDPLLAELHAGTLTSYRSLAEDDETLVISDDPAGLILLTDDPAAAQDRARELRDEVPELQPCFLAVTDLRDLEPIVAPDLCGVRLETGYPIPPDAATNAMARRATQRGAELRIGSPVAALLHDGGRVSGVRMADGSRVEAGAVLVAAGPWSPPLAAPDGDWRPMRPTHGVTVGVELATPARAVLEEETVHTVNRPVDDADADAGPDSIFSMVSVGTTTTIGSTFLARAPDPAALAPLLRTRGARFVPALGAAAITRVRVCARPQSVDGRPFIGSLPGRSGMAVCVGHGPWGISTGPASAELAVTALLDGAEASIPSALRADRPLPSGR